MKPGSMHNPVSPQPSRKTTPPTSGNPTSRGKSTGIQGTPFGDESKVIPFDKAKVLLQDSSDPSIHPPLDNAELQEPLVQLEALAQPEVPQQRGFLPVLKNRAFLTLWSGQVFSQLADKVLLLKYLGRTPAEQKSKQIAAMQILEGWMNEEVSPQQNELNRDFFEDFREIIDRERMPGCKLFSVE